MKVLVTGGAGFIGSHLCDYLLSRGDEVMAYDILVPQVHGGEGLQWGRLTRSGEQATLPEWPSYMDSRVVPWVGDVGNAAEMYRALQEFQPEVVIHLAAYVGVGQSWYHPSAYLYGGPVITAALMEAVAAYNATSDQKVRRVFVAGSMSSYGEGRGYGGRFCNHAFLAGQANEGQGSNPDPKNPYAIAKTVGERVALMLAPVIGVDVVVGRFFNVMGSRQALTNPYTGVGAIFCARLLSGQAPVVFEDGMQSRDFIHVSDVVRGIVTILDKAPSGEVYNVGTGKRTTVLELAQRLCEIHGQGLEPAVPGWTRKGDIRHCFADVCKLQSLGWSPAVTLDEAVRELWEWVSQQSMEDPEGFARAFGELISHKLLNGEGLEDLAGDGEEVATSGEE